MKFIGKIIVAATVAMALAFYLVWRGVSLNGVVVVYLCTAFLLALAMGAFDIREKSRYQSIKHRMGIKKAA